jgi:hypothetical protein
MVPSVATETIASVKPPGIDPETVRLVAQCLNHYATPGPLILRVLDFIVTTSFGYIWYCVCFNFYCVCFNLFCVVWVFW